ncbi:predicted protein [Pyrenophora tritici-repentis Pt-1C-BFP]|uniref:Uncharacterized protein n=1 Tax=Pyrenophora tritici-repentis (strain Pt-1C-BFP) TaxID=426418 RepID=B2W2V3_PYRTR|nr:uncharacterized protein PTRG_03751 [Pyrenophora tritici-repentis Pt-1C-BFP]EDU46589.1 predicted protein [Pyrenophora tritici-repentis Pt-1C-BFP]
MFPGFSNFSLVELSEYGGTDKDPWRASAQNTILKLLAGNKAIVATAFRFKNALALVELICLDKLVLSIGGFDQSHVAIAANSHTV